MIDLKSFLAHLNKEQYEAATTINGPLLIIAGAGSGKTMTLVARIANMISEGIEPSSILLLTFTNKAAKEMRDRVIRNIGSEASGVTASTFHSFCANFLRKHAHLLSIANDYTIIDTSDAAEVMSIVKAEYIDGQKEKGVLYDAKDFPNKKEILSIYSNSVNNCEKLYDVVSADGYGAYYQDIKEIIDKYIAYKRSHSFLDYDDLLLCTQKILTSNEDVRFRLGQKYNYVCCDEYQDTNILQDSILNLICRDHRNLAVVGDDNQSIYKFRGARIENILTFNKRFPDCKTVILHENYRSTQEILDLANSVMNYAVEGTPKTLHGQFHGSTPALMITEDDIEENFKIVTAIKKYHAQGIPLREMAVIVRNSSQSYGLETLLTRNNIPYNKFGGLKFLEKTVVRDILSFLRVIVNEKDEIALYRILQLYPGIGKGYSNKITSAVATKGLQTLNELYPKSAFHKYLTELLDTIEILRPKDVNFQLNYLLENYYLKTLERSIDCAKIRESEKLERKRKMFNDIEEAKTLYVLAEKYRLTSKFLEDIMLDATIQEDESDKLNITTIHSAKGLEYDVVFIMDVVEQITPRRPKDDVNDPEELRCFYVALTRARKMLYLFAPKSHSNPPFVIYRCELSHFINHNDVLDCVKRCV